MKEKGAFLCRNYQRLQSEEVTRSSGVPEVMDFLREHHVEEGDNIQIIRKLKDALIVGVKGSRFAMGNEIADRIQV